MDVSYAPRATASNGYKHQASMMGLIPARKAVGVALQEGQYLKVTNTHGKQVVDFWAFNPKDKHDHLSTVHTRTTLGSIVLKTGDGLYNTKRQPILRLVEDTTPGVHDLLWAACDAERYRMLGAAGYHDNCHDNLHGQLRDHFPNLAIPDDLMPDPLNLFMNVGVNHRGGLDMQAPESDKGQYVVLKAEADLVVVMSACPQDMASTNAGKPTDCEFGIFADASCTDMAGQHDNRLCVPAAVADIRPKVKVALSVDFDALSGWLGTGHHPDNNMADYSAGIFAAQVGYKRLLDVFKKMEISDKVTWFIPGHTIETFPEAVTQVAESGAEIGLHGYAHEGIDKMTVAQETDVLFKCMQLVTKLCDGRRPRGYRAPLYTIRASTIELLRDNGFLYDSSLTYHDSQPFWAPSDPPIEPIDYSQAASAWMKPSKVTDPAKTDPFESKQKPLVEIPCNWYTEDMTPMQFLPNVPNSHGYVPTAVIEQMWKDRFTWLWNNTEEAAHRPPGFVFPVLLHPDTSGMAHVIGMVERMLVWLKGWGDSVEFCTHEDIAAAWLEQKKGDSA